jgi:hypothetical protein
MLPPPFKALKGFYGYISSYENLKGVKGVVWVCDRKAGRKFIVII